MELRTHHVTLRGTNVLLRPLTEHDWALLLKWNNDPKVLYFAEGEDIQSYDLEQIQAIYRSVSQHAFCFVIEADGQPIGECWLQEMNLDRILRRYPNMDCRRIDLMIGEKAYWGRGLGSEAIRLLTAFAFERERADAVFGCDIADYNGASLRAFQKVGYRIAHKIEQPAGNKARLRYDVVLTKAEASACILPTRT